MLINIVIPTMDRLNLTIGTVDSLRNSAHKDLLIMIIVDGNKELFMNLSKFYAKNKFFGMNIKLHLNPNRIDWPASMNYALSILTEGYFVYASDDLIFEPRCISNAIKIMENRFPDGDGLIGFNQTNCKGARSAFGMMGQKFIERFKDRQVFCPEYIHFGSDTELGDYASSVKKFWFAEKQCGIYHSRLRDKTYRIGRKTNKRDVDLKWARKEAGLLWGKNFEFLNMPPGSDLGGRGMNIDLSTGEGTPSDPSPDIKHLIGDEK
jgi:hypothetical protein